MEQNKKLRVVLAGGGTGGHIYPAIAVAQRLKNDDDIEEIYYVGCKTNMEYDIAVKEDLKFIPVYVSGMPRKPGLSLIKWFWDLNKSVNSALRYFYTIKPDVILGTGGYVSGPALLAGIILRIPIIIHDPDAHPGIVSRFIAPWAKVVSVAFEQSKVFLNSKNIVVNGNPIRESFGVVSRETGIKELGLDPNKKTLLVVGGSQGAKKINEAMLEASRILVEEKGFQVIHQTGRKNYDEYIKELSLKWPEYASCPGYVVRPYFDDMSIPLSAANLAVSRAGSLSISELCISGLPAILVPYPFAAQDHQRYNARAMEKEGAALYLEDPDCSSDKLVDMVEKIFHDEVRLESMKRASLNLAKPDSTVEIIKLMKKIAK